MTPKYITEWDEYFGENRPPSSIVAHTLTKSLQFINTQLLKLLVWVDLQTGLVRKIFDYYDRYLFPVQCILFSTCAYILYKSIQFLLRSITGVRRTKRRFFSSSRTQHRRKKTPTFPPGMQVDAVLDRWKKKGHETPLVPLRSSHIDRQIEQARQRREISKIPSWEPSGEEKITSSFGGVEWNESVALQDSEHDVTMTGS